MSKIPNLFTGNTKRYYTFIMKYIDKLILPIDKKVGESILKTITGEIILGNKKENRFGHYTKYQFELFRGFSEINSSYEAICNTSIYINSHPFKRNKIPANTYMRFIIEASLHESYILKERLENHLSYIKNEFNKSNEIRGKLDKLINFINDSMEKNLSVRNSHVHQNRFSTNELFRLDTLALLSKPLNKEEINSNTKIINSIYRENYKKVRKEYKGSILSNISSFHKIIDIYFDCLYKIITDGKELINPYEHS